MNQININKNSEEINILNSEIQSAVEQLDLLSKEIARIVVGNTETINFIIIALLCNGHILLEGVPGVAKTTMVKAVANSLGLLFKRIQFTPDLLPADLIGTVIYNPQTREFETKKGPVFANIILADEINRASAKVQSALLESMQENQVTIGSSTYKLEEPFFVFATQNPIEQEGTYPLPEAQLDRFMFKLSVTYPTRDEEKEILKKNRQNPAINCIMTKNQLLKMQDTAKGIYVDEKIMEYIVNIVSSTRDPEMFNLHEIKNSIQFGASPRATIAIFNASKVHALLQKRSFVIPDDVKAVALPILRHRILLSYEAQADEIKTDRIIAKILSKIHTP